LITALHVSKYPDQRLAASRFGSGDCQKAHRSKT
jgi:hypothetical protein